MCSKGEILSRNNLIGLSCSTTSGMAGSPVVCGSAAVGVYVGGPPLPDTGFVYAAKNDQSW